MNDIESVVMMGMWGHGIVTMARGIIVKLPYIEVIYVYKSFAKEVRTHGFHLICHFIATIILLLFHHCCLSAGIVILSDDVKLVAVLGEDCRRRRVMRACSIITFSWK